MHEGRLDYGSALEIIDAFLAWGRDPENDDRIDFDEVILALYEQFGPLAVRDIVRAMGAQTLAGALVERLHGGGDEVA